MTKHATLLIVIATVLAGCSSPPVGHELKVVPPIQITEAERFRDGGSLRLEFVDEAKQSVIVHMDFRYSGPRTGEVLWVPRATYATHKLVPGGDQEKDLAAVLRQWADEHVPAATREKVGALDRPEGTEDEQRAWLVLRMIRTLELRSGTAY